MSREYLLLDHVSEPDLAVRASPHYSCSQSLLEECLIEIQQRWDCSIIEQACAIYRSIASKHWEVEYFNPGSAKSVHIDLKTIIRRIIDDESDAIILCHYHPDGTTQPSEADLRTTRAISQICRALNAMLVDHFIFGTEPCFSFRSAYYL